MGDIVNLRRARKARERAANSATAAEKRARFGTPKALRKLENARSQKEERDLEEKRLEDKEDEDQ